MSKPQSVQPDLSRRKFINRTLRITGGLCLASIGGWGLVNTSGRRTVWQIDPHICTQCGNCALNCVLTQSAVRCVHAFDVCGYCKLCGGFFPPNAVSLSTGAENQLCPSGAINRTFIENPYFEYSIDQETCIGCAKCVKGCGSFGNGSLFLQIQQDICLNCNECSIARSCPSGAISRIPAKQPYMQKGEQKQV